MNFVFCGSSIEECLKKASENLKIAKEDIKYKVIKEERKLFKKKVEIEILDNMEKDKENYKKVENKRTTGAKVEKGKIIVKNNDEEIIKIEASENIKLFLNGAECLEITDAKENDEITYDFEVENAEKSIKVTASDDKMNAFVSITSKPQPIYELVDTDYTNHLILKSKKVGDKYPERYSKEDIRNELILNKVIYGVIEENLEKLCNGDNFDKFLIAKGVEPIDDVKDIVEVLFKENDDMNISDNKKIDYRNLHSVINVKSGDVIARLIKGSEGSDGCDIFGKVVKRKTEKPIVLKVGTGCKLEGNEVISEIEGKPSFNNNIFNVSNIYEVKEVNLSSGNVKFIGEVKVIDNVEEGMSIKSAKSIEVGKNVDSSTLIANQNIVVNGNVITSTLKAGCDEVEQAQYIEMITLIQKNVEELTEFVDQIRHTESFRDRSDGEIIKILIENKFKSLTSTINRIINYYHEKEMDDSELLNDLKLKLLDAAPLQIKSVSELERTKILLTNELGQANEVLKNNANIYLKYCQGCDIEAAGSVYIEGKGQFNSNIIALDSIEFTKEKAVCRGGNLYATNEIKLKTVGSNADVKTILKVSRNGKIYAEEAYSNTIFCFGERQYALEVASKDIVAYLSEDGEVIVEKFKL